ncbi:ABC transporter ATP-binding protein [Aestuariivirga sp.]|uniref:ABC transporter ATP-binding protein n=1 Tax=Aestuariivirga sp. TaxID=2650926 RepID=UPI003BAA8EED
MNAPVTIKPTPAREAPGLPQGGDRIRLHRIAKSFGQRVVLDGLTLDIAPGEFVAVIGRSGCGKTTLLRLLAGLERISAGTIEVGGRQVSGLHSDVRLLFQEARLLPWQTVLGNVGIAREAGWKARAARALQDVGLGDRGGDWPAQLSGGQRQRVALARALVSDPRVLLLDEPFGALDALTRREMHDLLLRIWRERRFTTLLITHDVNEALALAGRVIVLRQGTAVLDEAVDRERSTTNAKLHAHILAHV